MRKTTNLKAALLVLGAFGSMAYSADYSAWTGHRTIILNTSATGANVAGNVYNFPVLVRLGSQESAILAAAKADGADIRFSKADDTTALPYQIESWSSTAAAIWVKVDSVKGNNATQAIRMHYGNAAATSLSNAAAVFDTTNGYVATYHMNGAATEVNASGHTELNAAMTGAVPAVAGLIGQARSYSGVIENYLSVPNSANGRLNFSSETDYTLSAWVFSDETTPDNRGIFNKGNDQWLIGIYGNGEEKYYDLMTRGGGAYNQAATSAAGNEITTLSGIGIWRHVVGVWKGSGTPQDTGRIYINGVLANTTFFNDVLNESAGRDMTTDVFIGVLWENGGLARPYLGRIDEVIASKVFRDSNWVKLSYQNQQAINTLVNIGNPLITVPGAPGTPVATASTTTTGSINVTWTAPASNGNATITAYTVTGTPGGTCATTGALTCTVTGLTAGTGYTFTVRATNSVGQGAASASSNSVTAPTSLLPGGSFVVRMDGTGNPYSYRIPASTAAVTEELSMTITDIHGKRVWSKTINPSQSRVTEITWNGRNTNGVRVPAGMYIARVSAKMDGQTVEAVRKGVNLK